MTRRLTRFAKLSYNYLVSKIVSALYGSEASFPDALALGLEGDRFS